MNGNLPLALNFGGYGADAERGGRGDAGILLARNLCGHGSDAGRGRRGDAGIVFAKVNGCPYTPACRPSAYLETADCRERPPCRSAKRNVKNRVGTSRGAFLTARLCDAEYLDRLLAGAVPPGPGVPKSPRPRVPVSARRIPVARDQDGSPRLFRSHGGLRFR